MIDLPIPDSRVFDSRFTIQSFFASIRGAGQRLYLASYLMQYPCFLS